MPAWGVRTALTALRSFMAEKGSAGQVGGMEAKKEVRERLARESEGWKCEGCGGRTNNEIMREWWEICKERGVKVEEEMSLEALPEGLNLEAREPGPKAEDSQPRIETRREPPQAGSSASLGGEAVQSNLLSPRTQPLPAFDPAALADSPAQLLPPDDRTQVDYPAAPNSHPITADNTLLAANNTSSTSRTSRALVSHQQAAQHSDPRGRSRPNSPPNPPAVTAPAPANPHNVVTDNNAEDLATGTIDKAIGALFVALLIMILKKIFYPAGESEGGMEGLYMSGD
jgi:hypothetical protein